jgi:hypothetical protein
MDLERQPDEVIAAHLVKINLAPQDPATEAVSVRLETVSADQLD